MNFVVIMNDTLRPDYLSAYGNDWVKTPVAEKFASEAAVFDHAYCGSWPTIPNRTDLLTGRFGEPIHCWLPLDYGEVTLPRLLGDDDYVTQLILDTPHLIQGGHNFDYPFHAWRFIRGQEVDHFAMDHDPIEFPFSDYSKIRKPPANTNFAQYLRNMRERNAKSEEDWPTWETYQTAVTWLEKNYKQENFFLWIDAFDPHEPPNPPQKYVDMYDKDYDGDVFMTHIEADKCTEAELHHTKCRYAGTVTFVDRCVGRVLQAIDDLGLREDTCVVWLSDHGTHVGEHHRMMGKTYQFDEVARTVFMVRMPGTKVAGQHFDHKVQPADLAPTLLEMAGKPVPDCMQGISFLPLLEGKEFKTREVAITAGTPRIGKNNLFIGARDGRWVLNDYADNDDRILYDMENDPEQTVNVAKDHPEVVERLHQAVVEFLKTHDAQEQLVRLWETGDPGDMTGYVPVRPGMEHYENYFAHTYNSKVIPE